MYSDFKLSVLQLDVEVDRTGVTWRRHKSNVFRVYYGKVSKGIMEKIVNRKLFEAIH